MAKQRPSAIEIQQWVPFVSARGNVMRCLGITPDEASEWLRRAAVLQQVRARFSVNYLSAKEDNRERDGYRSQFPSMIWGESGDNGVNTRGWQSLHKLLRKPIQVQCLSLEFMRFRLA